MQNDKNPKETPSSHLFFMTDVLSKNEKCLVVVGFILLAILAIGISIFLKVDMDQENRETSSCSSKTTGCYRTMEMCLIGVLLAIFVIGSILYYKERTSPNYRTGCYKTKDMCRQMGLGCILLIIFVIGIYIFLIKD